jgi:hypothetical protein
MKDAVFVALLAQSLACARATPIGIEAEDPDAAGSQPIDAGGSFRSDARPGTPDSAITPAAPLLINEFVSDHIDTDTNEFVEVLGDPGSDYSDWTLLVIEGDGTTVRGTVDLALPLGTTSSNGLFVTSMMSNRIENGTLTLLVVRGYDAGGSALVDIDANDDGAIDFEPWQSVDDAIAITDGDASDLTYAGDATLAPSFDGSTFRVGGASRIPDGQDSGSAADWRRNDFDGAGLSCCGSATPAAGEAINTPGVANAMQP